MHWTEIRGWLSAAEGEALRALAAGKWVLELGSFCGRSTVAMAEVAAHVTAVDSFRDATIPAGEMPHGSLPEFLTNLDRFGVLARVDVLASRIEDLDFAPLARSFDLVFVDAAHDPDSVERDTWIALGCVRPGGVIAWHDWTHQDIRQGVAWACLEPTSCVDSLAWLTLPE